MAYPTMNLQPSGARPFFDGFELDEVERTPYVRGPARAAPAPLFRMPNTPARRVEDHELMLMSSAFAENGGMVSADALVRSMRMTVSQPLSVVGHWIAEREAVQFPSRSQTWFPCFQFTGNPMSIRPAVRQIVLALRDTHDDWELALWFASRNVWLDNVSPVELIQRDAAAVVRAAQADRFIAKG